MVDIFEIPVYYISFNRREGLEKHVKDRGFKNIVHFPAIDGKKYTANKLANDNIITPRAFYDLKYGRSQHSGISSLGAIGCAMSHSALWKLCVDKKYPFICILEEDVDIKPLKEPKIKKIQNILSKPKSIFIGTRVSKSDRIMFVGLHLYIISKEACIELLKHFLPIDVQVDFYVSHMANMEKINLEGFSAAKQNGKSNTIQDICVKCILPKTVWPYILFLFVILLLVLFFVKWFTYKS